MSRIYNLPTSKIAIVPNGVRTECYQRKSKHRVRQRLGLQKDTKIIFFHGALRWKPNSDAAMSIVESISPFFGANSRSVLFVIAGPHPPEKLVELVRTRSNVKVIGCVPDIAEYICAADVCIVPLKSGSGTRLKILEYLAAGKPVVATRKAVEGLMVRNHV